MKYVTRGKKQIALWLTVLTTLGMVQFPVANGEEYFNGEGLAVLCSGCHGLTGISPNIVHADLINHNYDSLVGILTAHREGTLYHPYMLGAVEFLSDQDIKNIAKYYSESVEKIRGTEEADQLKSQKQPLHVSLTQITEDLYRFQYHITNIMVLVTEEGIVLVDAIIPEAAEELKRLIKEKFNLPIRYLVYSHEHSDHVAGAVAFAGEATIIAHDNAREELIAINNRNDRLVSEGKRFTKYKNTPLPDITFSDEMTLSIGGKTIKLYRPEPVNHTKGLILVEFVEDKTLQVSDMYNMGFLGFLDFRRHKFLELIETYKFLESIDVKYFAPSHTPVIEKQVLTDYRIFHEELRDAVEAAIDKGYSLEETLAKVSFDEYKDHMLYEKIFPLNIAGAYRALKRANDSSYPCNTPSYSCLPD